MKNTPIKILSYLLLLTVVVLFSQCKTEEPEPVLEEELITTLKMIFSPVDGGEDVVFILYDEDGNGPLEPKYTDDTLATDTKYNTSIIVRNDQDDEDITHEISEMGAEHQFFFQIADALNLSFEYADEDKNGDAIGLSTIFTTGAASNGSLAVVLRHEPNKSANGAAEGDLSNVGGETDIQATFEVVIE